MHQVLRSPRFNGIFSVVKPTQWDPNIMSPKMMFNKIKGKTPGFKYSLDENTQNNFSQKNTHTKQYYIEQ